MFEIVYTRIVVTVESIYFVGANKFGVIITTN